MINVSYDWVAAQKETLLPEMFLELTYSVTEPGLQEDASAKANSEAYFSDTEQVVDGTEKDSDNYASLEFGLWGLDGNTAFFDGSPDDPGFVSGTLSNASGVFATYPTITIDFGKQHTVLIPGLTITWGDAYNEWATKFRVTAYNAGSVVAQTTISGNKSPVTTVNLDMVAYNQIVIEVMEWNLPQHRARCLDIFLGVQQIYRKTDLTKFEHEQSADLLSASLPKNSIVFGLRNDDNRWNPDAPEGSEKYLAERQEITAKYGMDVNGRTEWIKGGTFWISEWSTPSNGLEAVFTASSLLEFMDETYTGARSGTLYAIALAALQQLDLPKLKNGNNRWVMDGSLKEITTNFTADTQEYTVADILQMVAHAGCCVFYQDRDGIIHIEPWKEVYSGYMIEPHISYKHPEYNITKPLKAVSVAYGENDREVIEVSPNGAVQTVDNPLIVTMADAQRVGRQAAKILENRKAITGEFRADVRLDVFDNIIVTSKYASNIIGVTDIKYSTTGGAFKGTYTGRVVSINLTPEARYSGEFRVGEV